MNTDHLIHMANRIGQFYQSYPDHAEALEGIANHIAKFWEPRMRRALLAQMDDRPVQTQSEPRSLALSPLVLQAIQLNKQRLMPSTLKPLD